MCFIVRHMANWIQVWDMGLRNSAGRPVLRYSCTVTERWTRRVTSLTNCVNYQLPDHVFKWPWFDCCIHCTGGLTKVFFTLASPLLQLKYLCLCIIEETTFVANKLNSYVVFFKLDVSNRIFFSSFKNITVTLSRKLYFSIRHLGGKI